MATLCAGFRLRHYFQFLALFSLKRGSGKTDGGPSTGKPRPLERCCTCSFAFSCRAHAKKWFIPNRFLSSRQAWRMSLRITIFVQEFAIDTCKTPIDTCNGVSMENQQPSILQSDWSIARDCGLILRNGLCNITEHESPLVGVLLVACILETDSNYGNRTSKLFPNESAPFANERSGRNQRRFDRKPNRM